jgi:signal transduction histidine kinase
MNGLIGDVLDFARGRLGGGLNVNRIFHTNLQAVLEQVVAELQTTSPERMIHCDIAIGHKVLCDSARLAQMLSNLLANALTHSSPDSPIWVAVQGNETHFEMSVTNEGEGIEPHIREQLFEPFARGTARPGQEGLGLGLYIASEIARAHEGSLEVTTQDGKICFTFKMPFED